MNPVSRKKVCVATGLYPPDIGGPATYAKMLEEQLPKAGIEVDILPFGTVRHLPKIVRHVAYARVLFKHAREADIIYALDSMSVGLPTLIVSRLLRKPFLVRLGGDYAWEQGRMRFGLTCTLDEFTEGSGRRPLPVRLLRFLQTFIVKRATKIILPSQYLKRIVMTWGIQEEKIEVIYSALFPLPVSTSRETLREQLQYDGLVLMTAARLTPWKGIDAMIRLVGELRAEQVPASLIVAGDGEARDSLEKLAHGLGLSEQVRFVGKLSKDALGAAIKASDVFVYNTSYEGLPHQLLEVMDLGTPVVTTKIAGNQEVIKDGVEGILVEVNDIEAFKASVLRIHTSEALRDRLVKSARARTKEFEQTKVTQKLIALLESV